MFSKNWGPFFVGVEPVNTTKPKIGRRKNLFLQQIRRTLRILPKAMSLQTAKLGWF